MAGAKKSTESERLEAFQQGRDEMNLAEFALAGASTRYLDGRKTVIFRDEVWDPRKRAFAPRELAVSGSDKYGLPTASDDDVLQACFQLWKLQGFQSPELRFTRYQVIQLLHWADTGRYYKRVHESLRRWKGLTVYSDRNFWDWEAQRFVDKDFGIIDDLEVYERDRDHGEGGQSRLVWSDFIWRSVKAGFLKRLDWQLYVSLKSTVAKRLYRVLDKRFYREESEFVIGLKELAFRHVGLSHQKTNSEIMRELSRGIEELEGKWPDLRALPRGKRFRQVCRGKWEVAFGPAEKTAAEPLGEPAPEVSPLVVELSKRGVKRNGKTGPEQIVRDCTEERIGRMLELFDHHAREKQPKSAAWLVAGCYAAEDYAAPSGFEFASQKAAKRKALEEAKDAKARREEAERVARESADIERRRPLRDYWEGLTPLEQLAIEEDAVRWTDPFKRGRYVETKKATDPSFSMYRELIIDEYLEREVLKLTPERLSEHS